MWEVTEMRVFLSFAMNLPEVNKGGHKVQKEAE